MAIFLIRRAAMGDAEGLHRLAKILNSTNLPDQTAGIREILMHSCASFEGKIQDPFERLYLFILEDTDFKQVIGSSQIIARHGTPESPHVYFQLENIEYRSESLGQLISHPVLRLGFDSEGMTELGGLILDPAYRHVPQKLGRALSLVRFWFIQNHQENFKEKLLAELLPPFDESGESPLWRSLGSHFMNLSYQEADHLSRKQKEFIETLLPKEPIYVSLLPQEAREVIGKVGTGSQPAAHMLCKLGFRFENRVDPFDGGPHFEMRTRDLPVIYLDPEVKVDLF